MLKYLIPLLLVSNFVFADEVKTKTPTLDKFNCSADFNGMKADLHSAGYEAFFISRDVKDKTVFHEVMYNPASDHLAQITLYTRSDEKTVDKICLDSVSVEPFGFGSTFKDFILHQKINDFNKAADAYIIEKKKDNEKQHAPYQGDPTKVNLKE